MKTRLIGAFFIQLHSFLLENPLTEQMKVLQQWCLSEINLKLNLTHFQPRISCEISLISIRKFLLFPSTTEKASQLAPNFNRIISNFP
jgi:hypothetical protein